MKDPTTKIKLPHPGDVLREDFLKPLGMTPNALALAIRVPASRVREIVHAKRSITALTAMRLARYFGSSAQFWMNMQSYYDLAIAEDEHAAEIERDVQPRQMSTA
jgi:addiction module HigA family antidote